MNRETIFMKKFSTVLLSLMLAAVMLTGCAQTSTAPTSTPAGTPAATDAAAPADPGQGSTIMESGTIRIIAPYGVGGTADAIARRYAAVAGNHFPQFNFIVENMTGGDGFLGADFFAGSSPDTTDLFVLGYGVAYRHDIGREHGTEEVIFDRHAIQPIAVIDDRTWIVYANPGVSVSDIIEMGNNNRVRMSGGNPLSDPHLAFGSLLAAEGGDVIVVPYDGGAMQRQALINNEVDVFVGTTQAGMEEVAAGLIVPILAISENEFGGFVTPEGSIIVPAVAGPNRAEGLSQDHVGSILPAGGFITVRRGADQAWVDLHTDIARAVWADPEFYEWMGEILLNHLELYGDDAEAFLEEAASRAMAAFEMLMGIN